jgi:hypothetical protein
VVYLATVGRLNSSAESAENNKGMGNAGKKLIEIMNIGLQKR